MRAALGALLRAAAEGRGLLVERVARRRALPHRRPRGEARTEDASTSRACTSAALRRCGRPAPGAAARASALDGDACARGGPRGRRGELVAIRCERGAEIARMLGFHEETAEAIRALDEHWNGRGHPDGLRGEEIPLLARIVCLAQTVDVFVAERGVDAALRDGARAARALVRAARSSTRSKRSRDDERVLGRRSTTTTSASRRAGRPGAHRGRAEARPDRRGVRAA